MSSRLVVGERERALAESDDVAVLGRRERAVGVGDVE